jgi:outer membrane protein
MIKHIKYIAYFSIAILMLQSCQNNTVYYIENSLVFNKYNGTKELVKRNSVILNPYKNKIDSIDLLIKNAENILQNEIISQSEKNKITPQYKQYTEEYNFLLERYFQLKNDLEENASTRIWTQINEGIAEYAKKEKIAIILGAMGNGNVMYADEGRNITEQIIKHLNDYYEGE